MASNGYELIKSRDNSKIKLFVSMHDRRKASKEGLVFIEGSRLCEDALLSGVRPVKVLCVEGRYELVRSWISNYDIDCEIIVTTDDCFSKISSTVNPQGIAMLVKEPKSCTQLPVRGDGKDIYVVLENLQDPGNMGTIIRMADAFDFNAVIMTDGCVDPYNEKVLRSSMGSVWHISLIRVSGTEDLVERFRDNEVSMIAADLRGALLDEAEITLPAAYFIGNEGKGLRSETSDMCDTKIKIPMPGKAESLNAASAASIMGYVLMQKRI